MNSAATYIVAIIIALTGVAYSEVVSDTDHYTAAYAVHSTLCDGGYPSSSFQVAIHNLGNGSSYFIAWENDTYTGSDSDLVKLLSALGAVAGVSSGTDWSSTDVCIGFDNQMFTVATADTRWLLRNMNTISEEEFLEWMLDNIEVSYYQADLKSYLGAVHNPIMWHRVAILH